MTHCTCTLSLSLSYSLTVKSSNSFFLLLFFFSLSMSCNVFLWFCYNYALSHLVLIYHVLASGDDFHISTMLTVRSYSQLNCLYICMYVSNYELNIV